MTAALAVASTGKSPNSTRSPQAFSSTSALSRLPCPSQEPRNSLLPSGCEYTRLWGWCRLTSSSSRRMQPNAVAGSWDACSNSGCAWWGGHLPQCFQVLPSLGGCFYHPFLQPPCPIWRVKRVRRWGGHLLLPASPLRTGRVFPLLHVGVPLPYVGSSSFLLYAFSMVNPLSSDFYFIRAQLWESWEKPLLSLVSLPFKITVLGRAFKNLVEMSR